MTVIVHRGWETCGLLQQVPASAAVASTQGVIHMALESMPLLVHRRGGGVFMGDGTRNMGITGDHGCMDPSITRLLQHPFPQMGPLYEPCPLAAPLDHNPSLSHKSTGRSYEAQMGGN